MALDTNIVGTNLDAGSNVKVALTNTPAYTGSVRLMSENDAGALLAGVPYLRSPETSNDYRLRTALDTIAFTDTFNSSVHNTNLWQYTFTTMTATEPGSGYLQIGTVQGTAATHGVIVRTYQYFPVMGTGPLSIEITAGIFTNSLVSNEIIYLGISNASTAGTAPTEGAYFKITNAGIFGAVSYNGVETISSWSYSGYSLNSAYKFTCIIAEEEVEFWFEDQLLGSVTVPTANGQPFLQGSLPIVLQRICTGSVSNTAVLRVTDVTALLTDLSYGKSYPHIQAGMGLSANIASNGNNTSAIAPYTQFIGTLTTGSSPLLITGTAGSNTAANATGLGGIGGVTATAAAALDIIATSYQVPTPSINISGRNLYITGVTISVINTGAAVATTPTTLLWGIGYGHTAVSMQTAESANTFAAATTHAPRRIQLGFNSAPIAAVIGQPYDKEITRTFQTPIVVRPGEFINTYFKVVVGTATASQVILYNVEFDGYFE